jgi:hypothetical protein
MPGKKLCNVIYVTYIICQTLWEGRKYWVRTKIAINYLKVSNFKYLERIASNYIGAGSAKEESDRHQERKKTHKCFILFCVIYINCNATNFNLHNYTK